MTIVSLLDTDFYKFTMQQIVFHRFSEALVEYQFFCRTEGVDFSDCLDGIKENIKLLCQLRLSDTEIAYLKSTGVFKADYLMFLKTFQLDEKAIKISHQNALSITVKGPWAQVILFETPLLAIINEAYYQTKCAQPSFTEGREHLAEKIALLKSAVSPGELKFADFGSRRRFSSAWQEEVLTTLQAEVPEYFMGTSNIFYAQQLNLKPIGTMAHEYVQAMQVLAPNLRESQRFAFQEWLAEYAGQLGVALSDTYTRKVFFKDFDKAFCLAFQGVRQDSGDPFGFAEAFIQQLEDFNIDPKTKTIIFSDSLTFPVMIDLQKSFANKIKLAFGIGTNLLNDVGFQPLNIVIKMTKCNDLPVAKISDDPQKIMATDSTYMQRLRLLFDIKHKAA